MRTLVLVRRLFAPMLGAALLAAPPASAQTKPQLIVAIAVDQFSADLFAEHRASFSGGLKRLAGGVVFPSGYQAHAATETCPGHSTILTGNRPSRTGIVANNWIDQSARVGAPVYCAEDPRVAGSSFRAYVPSTHHLLVPTLGERMKQADPNRRVVAVAGKDRAAIMMGGRRTDATWFLDPRSKKSFSTLAEHQAEPVPPEVTRLNARLDRELSRPARALPLPRQCATRATAVPAGTMSVGAGRFERAANDADAFRATPALDQATLDLAAGLTKRLQLGRRGTTDLLAIGLSATDYVGHRYGTSGSETCIQLHALDAMLGRFFAELDRARIDYLVMLTADHGGHDLPERNRQRALPDAQRVDSSLGVMRLGEQIAREFGGTGSALTSADLGDVYIDRNVPAAQRPRVLARAVQLFRAHPQVEAVFTAAQIEATPLSTLPPERWTLAERLRANYYKGRSGDLLVVLKERVTPIAAPATGYVATHGSPYDYDRRVPILFWRQGLVPFEQPNSVDTVDIAPTLASLIGLQVPADAFDGRCLDLDAGAGSTCR